MDIPDDCTYQVSGAFNILESVRMGFLALADTLPPPDDRILTVLWELGEPDGTYFSTFLGLIFVNTSRKILASFGTDSAGV